MVRVLVIDPKTATGEAATLLAAVQAKLGVTPNFIRVLANSPKALEGFLGLYGAAAFAKALNDNLGEVTTAEFEAARAAGLSDAEIVEAIAIVALNIFTNVLGKATRVEIDFPKVELMDAPLTVAA
jgi:alkylhydroperoxidase family enzyme